MPRTISNRAASVDKTDVSREALTRENNKRVQELENRRIQLHKYYSSEEKVKVKGAPSYQAYFGKVMTIVINGIMIAVPLDGRSYEIPKSYAEVFNTRIRQIDNIELQQTALADVAANSEKSPGALDLITPV